MNTMDESDVYLSFKQALDEDRRRMTEEGDAYQLSISAALVAAGRRFLELLGHNQP